MKKILFVFALLLISISGFCQKQVGSYYSKFYESEFKIFFGNDEFTINGVGENGDERVRMSIPAKVVVEFIRSLETTADIFDNKIEVAKKNGLKDTQEAIAVAFPYVIIRWNGDNGPCKGKIKLDPQFFVQNGVPSLQCFGNARSGFRYQEYRLVFVSLADFREFIFSLRQAVMSPMEEN